MEITGPRIFNVRNLLGAHALVQSRLSKRSIIKKYIKKMNFIDLRSPTLNGWFLFVLLLAYWGSAFQFLDLESLRATHRDHLIRINSRTRNLLLRRSNHATTVSVHQPVHYTNWINSHDGSFDWNSWLILPDFFWNQFDQFENVEEKKFSLQDSRKMEGKRSESW